MGDRKPEVMERAQADVDAGRPWNAANRLQGYLVTDPLNVPARLMLGQVLLDMGATTEAGRALLPSERDDPPAREAIAAWLAELEPMTQKHASLIHKQGFSRTQLVDQLGPTGEARMRPVSERARAKLAEQGVDLDDPPAEDSWVFMGCGALGCGGVIAVFGAGLFQIWKWLGL